MIRNPPARVDVWSTAHAAVITYLRAVLPKAALKIAVERFGLPL
jgi:hypothetical protein